MDDRAVQERYAAAVAEAIGWHAIPGPLPPQRAVDGFRRLDEPIRLATMLDHLGDCQAAMGDEHAARSGYQEALDIVEAIEPTLAAQVRAKLQGFPAVTGSTIGSRAHLGGNGGLGRRG